MAVEKRSVSFDPEVARRIEAVAAEEGVTFSAFVNRAAAREATISAGLAAAQEVWDEIGHPTPEERADAIAWVDQLLNRQERQ